MLKYQELPVKLLIITLVKMSERISEIIKSLK